MEIPAVEDKDLAWHVTYERRGESRSLQPPCEDGVPLPRWPGRSLAVEGEFQPRMSETPKMASLYWGSIEANANRSPKATTSRRFLLCWCPKLGLYGLCHPPVAQPIDANQVRLVVTMQL